MGKTWIAAALGLAGCAALAGQAQAASCGATDFGFEGWKQEFAKEAQARGAGPRSLAALAATHYNHPTIRADRGMHSFKLSFDEFMRKRGGQDIINQGIGLKKKHAALFAQIKSRYGVPAGPLLAIWGMETGFGSISGKQELLSAVATLAYDCRRPEFFTDHLNAAMKLIDAGKITGTQRASMHGEIGQTQFMPKAVLEYGVGNMETAQGALMSTANFLRAHGWRAGAGYQQGEPNYSAIAGWNAATVYQQAIAYIGKQIDDAP
jgi:membrane-bound lytic murein transglycosylase B